MEKRLSLFDYYAVPQNSKIRRQIALLKKRGTDGDYQTKELELFLNTPRNIEYLYNSLIRYAKSCRGIVYTIMPALLPNIMAAQGLSVVSSTATLRRKNVRKKSRHSVGATLT